MRMFLLGSGFSKAVSSHMPVLSDLSAAVREKLSDLSYPADQTSALAHDAEALMTFLYQRLPWRTAAENHLAKAAYYQLADDLVQIIEEAETRAFSDNLPGWTRPLVEHLHANETVVVSLNYDTVLERLAFLTLSKFSKDKSDRDEFRPGDTYPLHVIDIRTRQGRYVTRSPGGTFELLKIHGSINWFYPGTEMSQSHEIYYRQVDSPSPADDCLRWGGISEVAYRDLSPLIIPPVMEKSSFYAASLIASLWIRFRHALENSQELYIIGSSLPKTDVPLESFLRVYSGGIKTVYPVDVASGEDAERLKHRIGDIFGAQRMDLSFLGDGAVEKLATALT